MRFTFFSARSSFRAKELNKISRRKLQSSKLFAPYVSQKKECTNSPNRKSSHKLNFDRFWRNFYLISKYEYFDNHHPALDSWEKFLNGFENKILPDRRLEDFHKVERRWKFVKFFLLFSKKKAQFSFSSYGKKLPHIYSQFTPNLLQNYSKITPNSL